MPEILPEELRAKSCRSIHEELEVSEGDNRCSPTQARFSKEIGQAFECKLAAEHPELALGVSADFA